MTWLVWRQHRQQALAAAIAMLAVALFLVPERKVRVWSSSRRSRSLVVRNSEWPSR